MSPAECRFSAHGYSLPKSLYIIARAAHASTEDRCLGVPYVCLTTRPSVTGEIYVSNVFSAAPVLVCRPYLVENLKTVVLSNFWPGRRTVDGKWGLLGESGKCCVSRQKP